MDMDVFEQKEEVLAKLNTYLDKNPLSISYSSFSGVPRVDFKKLKLSKLQNLDGHLKTKNITRFFLDEAFLQFGLPATSKETTEKKVEEQRTNPLRKKFEKEENIPIISDIAEEPAIIIEPEVIEVEKEIINQPTIDTTEEDKPKPSVTFNLEAQIAQDEESVIFSPSIVSLPPLKEDVISTSGEQSSFVWPPPEEISNKENLSSSKKRKEKKKSKKPYYINLEQKEEKSKEKLEEKSEVKPEEKPEEKIEEKKASPKTDLTPKFPWLASEQNYLGLDDIVHDSLETELLGEPTDNDEIKNIFDVSKKEKQEEELIFQTKEDTSSKYEQEITDFSQPSLLKALSPEIPDDLYKINIFNELGKQEISKVSFTGSFELPSSTESGKISNDTRKAKTMFGKSQGSGNKLSPIGIMLLGGLTATLSYLAWIYVFPEVVSRLEEKTNNKIVVRNLFKQSNAYKRRNILATPKPQAQPQKKDNKPIQEEEKKKDSEDLGLNLITDKDREELIQKAKESREERIDPFGEDQVLPPITEETKEVKEEDKPPPDISLLRKQVELVGILSTIDKNLALVNIYSADYAVAPGDDKEARDSKLKTALSMTVPNRIEVSLLDPIEDWYVKQIIKSKSRSDDPTIELVKGDKKFKLKVGQKLLLPEERPFDEVLNEHLEKYGPVDKKKSKTAKSEDEAVSKDENKI